MQGTPYPTKFDLLNTLFCPISLLKTHSDQAVLGKHLRLLMPELGSVINQNIPSSKTYQPCVFINPSCREYKSSYDLFRFISTNPHYFEYLYTRFPVFPQGSDEVLRQFWQEFVKGLEVSYEVFRVDILLFDHELFKKKEDIIDCIAETTWKVLWGIRKDSSRVNVIRELLEWHISFCSYLTFQNSILETIDFDAWIQHISKLSKSPLHFRKKRRKKWKKNTKNISKITLCLNQSIRSIW